MTTLTQDLRYGLRVLAKNPGFTAIALLTLALGIGATTAIFSVIDAVLLNRLPYPNAERLVMVWEQEPERGWYRNIVSAANFLDWRKQNHVFTQMAAIDETTFDLSGNGEPLEVRGEQVSANFFSVLGVQPAVGRTFTPEEDRPGGPRVAVLSNALWNQRFGGDRGLVGREIDVNHLHYTVIGVMPPALYFPPWGDRAEMWIAGLDLTRPERTWHEHLSIARLQPGVTFHQAQAEMDTIARRLAAEHPDQKGWGVQLVNLHDQVVVRHSARIAGLAGGRGHGAAHCLCQSGEPATLSTCGTRKGNRRSNRARSTSYTHRSPASHGERAAGDCGWRPRSAAGVLGSQVLGDGRSPRHAWTRSGQR